MPATQPSHNPGGWLIRVQVYLRHSRLRPSPLALSVAWPNGGKTCLSSLLSWGLELVPQRLIVLTFDDILLTAKPVRDVEPGSDIGVAPWFLVCPDEMRSACRPTIH